MTETRIYFEWKTPLPPWIIALFAVFFIIYVYKCYKHTNIQLGLKILLGTIRIVIFLIFLIILCDPIWREETLRTRKSTLLVLTDVSLSMNTKDNYIEPAEVSFMQQLLPDTEDKIRIDIIRELLSQSVRLKELEKECELKYYQFSDSLIAIDNINELKAQGQRTNIYQNLVKIIETYNGRIITGIYLLTDGQHNTGEKTQLLQKAIQQANLQDIPITTIGMGTSEKKKDIQIINIEAPEIALVDDKVRFQVEIRNIGFEGQSVPIYLKWGDTLLRSETVQLEEEETSQRFDLYHTFVLPEEYTLTIFIPTQEGEFTDQNNYKQVNIKIIKEKIRVLYVENMPRWEYRYLKNALVRDETVVANTWLYSADSTFPQEKSKSAPEIHGFPSKEELKEYHCILLGDVPSATLGPNNIQNIVQFVEEGGGLSFIAGMIANPNEYWDTPLANLLPFQIEFRGVAEPTKYPQYLKLTAEGKQHPIMKLSSDYEENLQLWESEQKRIVEFYWAYPILKTKPGTTILATHRQTNHPIMMTQLFGKGRTFFTALDSSWRWRYLIGDRYFYRFWGQVIRYTGMGKLSTSDAQYNLRSDDIEYTIGETVHITLTHRNPLVKSPPQSVEIQYTTPDNQEKTKQLISNENDRETLEGTILATQIGTYTLHYTAPNNKELQASFQVISPKAESGNTELLEKDLQTLSKQTNALYLKPHQFEEQLQKVIPKKEYIKDKDEEYPAWDHIYLLLFLLALFTIEWFLHLYNNV